MSSHATPVYASAVTVYVGTVRSSTAVTTPNAPRPSAAAGNHAWSRSTRCVRPSASMISSAVTALERLPLRIPEPWVPVAAAPATEMWGSEPRLWRARPSAARTGASCANVTSPSTRTRSPSTSIRVGRSSSEISAPSVSPTSLNVCRVACTRSDSAPAITAASSSRSAGSSVSAAR